MKRALFVSAIVTSVSCGIKPIDKSNRADSAGLLSTKSSPSPSPLSPPSPPSLSSHSPASPSFDGCPAGMTQLWRDYVNGYGSGSECAGVGGQFSTWNAEYSYNSTKQWTLDYCAKQGGTGYVGPRLWEPTRNTCFLDLGHRTSAHVYCCATSPSPTPVPPPPQGGAIEEQCASLGANWEPLWGSTHHVVGNGLDNACSAAMQKSSVDFNTRMATEMAGCMSAGGKYLLLNLNSPNRCSLKEGPWKYLHSTSQTISCCKERISSPSTPAPAPAPSTPVYPTVVP